MTVITAILSRSDYQLIKIQWLAKQIPGGFKIMAVFVVACAAAASGWARFSVPDVGHVSQMMMSSI